MNFLLEKLYMLPSAIYNRISLALHKADVGNNVVINGRLRLYGKGHLKINDNVRINSLYRMNPIGGNTFTSIYICKDATVEIGSNTGISNVAIYASVGIKFGRFVKIGGNTRIYDTDFHSVNYEERRKEEDPGVKSQRIIIDDDVFIGANCTILKGVTIGKTSVVAAGSVVTKSIPSDEIWGGVPAKPLNSLIKRQL